MLPDLHAVEEDVREWVRRRQLDVTCAGQWSQAGEELCAHLEQHLQKPRPPAGPTAGPPPRSIGQHRPPGAAPSASPRPKTIRPLPPYQPFPTQALPPRAREY
jgi:hypothetical protein